jgi:SAM-dependent methyltransferase
MKLAQFLLYNVWYYLTQPPWDTGISPPEVLDFLGRRPAGRALDLGCGTGTNVITLAQHGWQAVGVDFAWGAIRRARRKAREAGVKADFYAEDVTQLKSVLGSGQDPFDYILDMGCFHSLPGEGRKAYLANLRRLLAPGGTYMLYGFLSEPGQPLPGLRPEDSDCFASFLELVSRQEGSDRAGGRRSVWLTFERPPSASA